jgi:hypothetical protein
MENQNPMQHRSILNTATAFLMAILGSQHIMNAQTSAYDVTSFNGSYAYGLSGCAFDSYSGRNTHIAEAGRLTADGASNVSGADTVIIDGGLVRRTFTGNYTINSDGTGTLVLNPSWGPQIHADLIAGEGGRVIKFVITDDGSTLSGVIESQQAASQTPPSSGYDRGALRGGYEYRIDGTAVDFYGNVTPIREMGRLSADGAGNLTGSSTVSINGYVVRRTLSGTYSINPDGSGSATLYPSWGPPIDLDLFVSANGLKASFVITDAGSTLTGAMAAQSLTQ